MKIISGVEHLPQPLERSVVTIGNFDGVHEGHRHLLRRLVEAAREAQAPSVVFTFNPHPVQLLHPERAMTKLFDLDDQSEQLEALGIDYLILEPFSREFSQLKPEIFLRKYIFTAFNPERVIVGHDFSFGVNRTGTIEFLQAQAELLNIGVEMVPAVQAHGHVVSSTLIRQALREGNVELARLLLGRAFYLKGIVEKGEGRGQTIGVPTANLHVLTETLPQPGVYAGWVWWRDRRWAAVTNIGRKPTFGENHPMRVESHMLDFEGGELYGAQLRVEFCKHLRSERKFASADALVAQIRKDIETAKAFLV